jgi:micrococcal nuclease
VVTKVIDGDTFDIDTGEKVRLIGIDTPELHHPTKPIQCFGKEAMSKMKELVEGKTVRLEKDISETDRYGRLLRFVYLESPSISATPVPSGKPNELFVNAYLVEEGYAHAATFPPDVNKADLFKQLERRAMINNKGLWQSCPAS